MSNYIYLLEHRATGNILGACTSQKEAKRELKLHVTGIMSHYKISRFERNTFKHGEDYKLFKKQPCCPICYRGKL